MLLSLPSAPARSNLRRQWEVAFAKSRLRARAAQGVAKLGTRCICTGDAEGTSSSLCVPHLEMRSFSPPLCSSPWKRWPWLSTTLAVVLPLVFHHCCLLLRCVP